MNFINLILNLKKEIKKTKNINELEKIRINFFGKNGFLKKKYKKINYLSNNKKKDIGIKLNKIKKKIFKYINYQKIFLEKKIFIKKLKKENIDISLPGLNLNIGNLHPISKTIEDIQNFFLNLGFKITSGPEIEDIYHNFDALNFPLNHPSRTDYDTFRFNSNLLLRTQTSCVQIREMKNKKPPIKIISSGKVYRNDYDKNHTPMFHQVEGLLIDKNISFSNLKYILSKFLKYFFGKNLKMRFRPSFFPFTEPSAEIDILNKKKQWIEVLGCGMVHPNVLKNVNINSKIYSGLAFGIGVERLAMILYDIKDLRVFFKNDIRFLKQFK